jgi:histone H3/H4
MEIESHNLLNKPTVIRLSKIAGIKNVSADSYDILNKVISQKIEEIIDTCLILNSEKKNKIVSKEDLYNSLNLLGYNLT